METPLINLHPEAETAGQPLLDLHEGVNTPTLSDDVVKNRGVKYHLALGEASPGVDALINSVTQGTEDIIRQNAVNQAYLDDKRVKADLIDNYIQQRPRDVPPVPGEMAFLQSLSTSELLDKSDVLEKKYAEWVVNTSYAEDKSGQIDGGIVDDADGMDATTKVAVGIVSTSQLAQRLQEESAAATGFFDRALTIVPFYENIQSRIQPEGSNVGFYWLQGSSRKAQLESFWLKPEAERTQILLDIEKQWKEGDMNPAIAQDFFKEVQRYSEFAKGMANAGSVLDFIELVPGGLVFDAVSGSLKAGSRVGKRISNAAARKTATATPGAGGVIAEGLDNAATAQQGFTSGGRQFTIKETPIKSSRTGEDISARLVTTEGGYTVEIDPARLQKDFDDKVWTKPRVEGVTPLPEDVFGSADEWREFLIHHETAHIDLKRKPDESLADYENAINQAALSRMGQPQPYDDIIAKGGEKVIAREVVDPDSGKVTTQVIPDTPANRAQGVVDAAIENGAKSEFDPVDINVTNGNLEEAAIDLILQDVRQPVAGTDLGYSKRLSNNLASFFNPERYVRRASNWSEAAKRELADTLMASRNKLLESIRAGIQARSVTREQLEGAMDLIKAEAMKRYHNVNNAILDAEWQLIDETQDVAGRTLINVPLGRPDGTLFQSAEAALEGAVNTYNLKPGSFSPPIMKGNGWFIRVSQPVDLNSNGFRDLLIDTANTTPETMAAEYTQFLLGGNTFFSKAGRENRRIAASQQSRVYDLIVEAAGDIAKPSKKEVRLLEAFLEKLRDMEFQVPADGPSGAIQDSYKRGYWYKTVDQFEMAWKADNGAFPSKEVTTAYFQYKNLMDFQYLMINTKTVRDKSRMGMANFNISTVADDGRGLTLQQVDKPIEARIVDNMEPDKRVHIIDSDRLENKYINTKTEGVGVVEEYRKAGYRILQLANPGQFPLKNIVGHDNYVNYVMVKDFRESPLDMMQIPYQEGGHIRVNMVAKVAQPVIRTTANGEKVHLGDRLFIAAGSEAEAKKFYSRIEEARKLYVAGAMSALDSFLRSGKLPMKNVAEFAYYFEPRKPRFEGDLDIEPIFDKNVPFGWAADQVGMNDAAKTHLRDEFKGVFDDVLDTVDDSTNLYRELDKEFTGQKSPMAYTIEGDEGAWQFAKARHVNPMQVMQDSLSRMARNISLGQLQRQTVENWVQEFRDVFDVDLTKVRQDPFHFFMNPVYNRGAKPERVGMAKAQRMAGMQFLGLRDPTNRVVDMVRNRVLNSVYERMGKGKAEWVDDHMMPLLVDPSSYIRAAAFHPTMGFFNPVQIFVQGVTLFHTAAMTGNLARSGTALAGATMISMGRLTNNPQVIAGFAKKAAKFGWKEEEFKELWQLTRDQGVGVVGGEYGALDNVFGQKLFQGAAGNFLDKGLIFFRETERMIRLNAFSTAYREFRAKNPGKTLTASDISSIKDRAGTMAGDMMNDANSFWQQGILSIPLQFSSFHARLVEQLLGKQLTKAEKVRVLAMYSTLYGLPVGATVGLATNPVTAPLALYPWGEDIRQAALERGIQVNDGVLDVFMNGLISVSLEALTGTQFNVAGRTAPNGLTLLRDILQGDKTAFEIAAGPAYTVASDVFSRALPAVKDILTFDMTSLKEVDAIGAFQGISTVSNMTKAWYAITTGKFMTKNGTIVGEMSAMEAWVMATVGLTPQEFSDSYIKIKSMKDLATAEQELNREFKKYIRSARELPAGSPEREAMVAKAYTFLAERPDPKGTAARLTYEVMSGDTQVETVDKKFLKRGPAEQLEDRKNAFQNENEQE